MLPYHVVCHCGVEFMAVSLQGEGTPTVWSLHEMGDKVRTLVAKFWELNPQEQREPMRRPQVRQSLPPEEHYKANFDAAFFEESGLASVGVVYRDHTGQIIGALLQNISLVQFVEMAEALAARRAMLFAKEFSLFRVIIEGNCSRVIDALKGSGHYRTLYGHVIYETKRLGGTLRSYMFQHVR